MFPKNSVLCLCCPRQQLYRCLDYSTFNVFIVDGILRRLYRCWGLFGVCQYIVFFQFSNFQSIDEPPDQKWLYAPGLLLFDICWACLPHAMRYCYCLSCLIFQSSHFLCLVKLRIWRSTVSQSSISSLKKSASENLWYRSINVLASSGILSRSCFSWDGL